MGAVKQAYSEEIEINALCNDHSSISDNDFFEAMNYADNQDYVEKKLTQMGLFNQYMTWIYLNIK